MANGSSPAPAGSAFEIVSPGKSKKTSLKGVIIALLVLVFLGGAIFLGVTLVRQNQDIREEASGAGLCPAAEQCPSTDGTHLLNCTPPESDNTPADSLCNTAASGRIGSCGGTKYCCNGTRWTVNVSACPGGTTTPTPTPTIESLVSQSLSVGSTASPTATATASATATSTARSSATPTASSSSTPIPVPETGTSWPTYAGVGVGIIVIIASILLAI